MSLQNGSILIVILVIIFFVRLQFASALYRPDPNQEFLRLSEPLSPIRGYFTSQLNSILPPTQAGLLAGILLGVKSDLPEEFKKALITTSTIHIVVVSGQNLSLVVGFILGFSPIFGRRPTIFISLLTIAFYSLLTGFQLPVIRAAIMSILILLSQLFGRDRESSWILALTAWIMLMYNPNWLLSISFQLSFMATLGALIISKTVVGHLNFLPDVVKQDAAVSISTQALTLPIIAANFHQISLIGVLANLFVLWTVGPMMILGAVALLLTIILPVLGLLFSIIPNIFLTYFIYVVTFFSQLPMANLPATFWNIYLSAGFYLLVFSAYLGLRNYSRKTLG